MRGNVRAGARVSHGSMHARKRPPVRALVHALVHALVRALVRPLMQLTCVITAGLQAALCKTEEYWRFGLEYVRYFITHVVFIDSMYTV